MDAIDAAAGVVRRYRIHGDAVRRARAGLAHLALGDAGEGGASRRSRRRRACTTARSRSTASRTRPTAVHDEALRRLFEHEKDAIAIIKWKEMLDLLELATDALRGRRQRARGRRRQARVARHGALARHRRRRGGAGLRLHQRLPRRRQLDRDRRVDAGAVAGQGGRLGGVLQLRRRRSSSAPRSPRRSAPG